MDLFAPRTDRILWAAEEGGGSPDRLPDSLAGGAPRALREEMAALVGEDRTIGRLTDLVRYASDASPYRRVPRIVVQPQGAA